VVGVGLERRIPSSAQEGMPSGRDVALRRSEGFPRLRYMGSKYRLLPRLVRVFDEVGGATALDAFSGSGVVAYALKALGFGVTANDFLAFPSVIAAAVVENDGVRLDEEEIERICGEPLDDRAFIARTFDAMYFTAEDRRFLDAAWSHVDRLPRPKRELAIAGLILAAARKQPRGVFTVSDLRYDDGRRSLRLPHRDHVREAVRE
jgi:DNA adenine methylase/adenine-specific DNA-methyltransferase